MAAVLLYLCFAFVLWVFILFPPLVAGEQECPSSCVCLGNYVDCGKRGLLKIPKDIKPWVTSLELQSNFINEIQPDDFKGLTNLTHLDLSKNAISVIPESVFRDLINLRTLVLDSNQLTVIPQFQRPLNVTRISLKRNHITKVTISVAMMQTMPKLEELDLSHNSILSLSNASFPAGCALKILTLDNNRISSIQRGSLYNLSSLEVLLINGNKLTELSQRVFHGLVKLKRLEINRNQLTVIHGLTFKGLNSLEKLNLKSNKIAVLSDGAFYDLKITKLVLNRNRITNITKGWLYGLNTLKQLTLSHNHISKIEPDAWTQCGHLGKLNLTHNRLTAITENSFASLVSLKILDLDYNRISRIDSGAFRDLAKLKSLQLDHNKISWTVEDLPGPFRGLSSLHSLSLRHNEIRSLAVHTFSGMPKLEQLLLQDNEIRSIKQNVFETLRMLTELRFNTSKLFCDCNLTWLPKWLRKNAFQSSAIGKCYHPPVLRGLDMYKVDGDQLTCTKHPKPVILENPKSTNGYRGENLTLSCTIGVSSDSQQPVIHWKKDNMPLGDENTEVVATSDGEVNRFTTHLHLVDIEDSMGGSYQCMVSNDFGSAFSQKAFINVYVFPSFSKKPKDITVKAGKPAELKCAATGKPTPVISWQKDGGVSFPAARERRMQVYPDDDRFYIMHTRPADEGVYSCMAKSEAGMVVHNATVTVLETPDFIEPMQRKKNVRQGEQAVLQCIASGSPQPLLTWMKDGKEILVTPRHFFTAHNELLVIVNTVPSDAGVYSCRMSNSLGTAKGSTKLQILPASGGSSDDGDSSFGLDDESTTTGIIIIAVVCCVVGTSLVWVIIIYQTRKRHEVYSATPTDETTLPVEVPSSGYMSSDKEGSYTQTGGPPSYYYYQDYQMKESGYESSSGQYRVNGGHSRAMAMFAHDDDDEDDQSPPVVTAGDRLLQQIRKGQSKTSLQYPAGSDGEDTIGSRHSTSSGQHSGASSSDPPSSHNSGHSATGGQPQQTTNNSVSPNPSAPTDRAEYIHSHPPPLYPHRDEQQQQRYPPHHFSSLGRQPYSQVHHHAPVSSRPVHLQTFHPTKTNHDRLNRSISAISTTSSLGRKEEGCCACPECDSSYPNNLEDRGNIASVGAGFRERHHSDSCDNRDLEHQRSPSTSTMPSCAACHATRLASQSSDKGCSCAAVPVTSSRNNLRQIRSPLSSSRSDNNVHNVYPSSTASSSSPSSSPVSQLSSQKHTRGGHQDHVCTNTTSTQHGTPCQDRVTSSSSSSSLSSRPTPSSSAKNQKSFCTECSNIGSSPHAKPHRHHHSSPSPPLTSPSYCEPRLKKQQDSPHHQPSPSTHPNSKCLSCHCSTSLSSKPMGTRSRSSNSVGQGDAAYLSHHQDQCLPMSDTWKDDVRQPGCEDCPSHTSHREPLTLSHSSHQDCMHSK